MFAQKVMHQGEPQQKAAGGEDQDAVCFQKVPTVSEGGSREDTKPGGVRTADEPEYPG